MAEQKPTILVVDDDKDDLDKVRKALAPIQLEISTLQDPHKVLQVIESTTPHLVILDALLPGLSGFDLCKQIKTSAGTKKTTVLILTGVYLKDRYRREAIHQFKADGFATKPFRDRELQRLVLKLLADKLKMSPMELQDRLVQSKEIFVPPEKEEKPGILGRIFGRLRSTPAPSVSGGFLHTASSTSAASLPAREDSPDEGSAGELSSTEADPEAAQSKSESLQMEAPPDAVQAEPAPDTVQSEIDPATVQAEPGPATVQAEPGPDTVQAELGPATVQAELGPATVQEEPGPATVQAEPGPATVQEEPDPDTVQAEPGPDTVQAEPSPDTIQAESSPDTRAETIPDAAPIEPGLDAKQAEVESIENGGVAPAAPSEVDPESAKDEEEDIEMPKPELVEQLDIEADATLAEIVESELKTAGAEGELPEGKPVEPLEIQQAQPGEEIPDSDREGTLPSAQKLGVEREEPASAEEEPTDHDVASDFEAAKAVFDALGPVPGVSTGEFKLPEEGDSDSATVLQENETDIAEPIAPEKDDLERPKETDRAPSEISPDAVGEELPIYPEEAFLHELRREVMMCRRVDRPLTLILIRIADLGQIVELFGKDFRPKVMRHVAIQAIEALREVDIVGLLEAKELLALTAFASDRYGGERIVSRLQATLGRNPFQVGEGIPSFIPKLRFGMAAYPKEAANSEELLERAEDEVEPTSSTN